jgi:tRNA threonylcarbamoyladenosine biosynthesis protein TsaE
MIQRQVSRVLSSETDTARLAIALGAGLSPGDCLLLSGDIGAGKTALARALIQSLQDIPEDVPSPTYTLVQTYETARGPVWHSDLYRITDPGELEELGLIDAFDDAICLVEWPDRLGDLAPRDALHLCLETIPQRDDARRVTLTWSVDRWSELVTALMEGQSA